MVRVSMGVQKKIDGCLEAEPPKNLPWGAMNFHLVVMYLYPLSWGVCFTYLTVDGSEIPNNHQPPFGCKKTPVNCKAWNKLPINWMLFPRFPCRSYVESTPWRKLPPKIFLCEKYLHRFFIKKHAYDTTCLWIEENIKVIYTTYIHKIFTSIMIPITINNWMGPNPNGLRSVSC